MTDTTDPQGDRTALRDRIAMAIEDAPYRHDGTRRAWQLADAVLAVLPAPVDRTAILREAADTADRLMDERYGPDCSYAIGGGDVARELRRMAGEAQQPETQAEAHPPTVTWEIESPRRGTWASWGTTYDEHDWARERFEDAIGHVPARQFRLVRATTTYTVEAEHQPAVARQADAAGEQQ
jgi:hypothetical protein